MQLLDGLIYEPALTCKAIIRIYGSCVVSSSTNVNTSDRDEIFSFYNVQSALGSIYGSYPLFDIFLYCPGRTKFSFLDTVSSG